MRGGPVVLVGSALDPHVAAISERLAASGAEQAIVDAARFPDDLRITLGGGLDEIEVEDNRLGAPAAVYVRDLHSAPLSPWMDLDAEMQQNWRRTLVALREKAHVMFSLLARWAETGVPIYNPPAPEWRLSKPFQLALLRDAGLPVPETLWTNDPDRVREFAERRRIIYKPIAGGAATREVTSDHLTEERLAKLAGAPVTFQQLLPGDNYRVYCLDGEVIACHRITSEQIDFRQNEEIVEATSLPDDVLSDCLRATEILGLRWTGMDLKEDEEGCLRILELNSSPMFLGFDARSGTDVLGALVTALASHQA